MSQAGIVEYECFNPNLNLSLKLNLSLSPQRFNSNAMLNVSPGTLRSRPRLRPRLRLLIKKALRVAVTPKGLKGTLYVENRD
jgi:hypothetical protein